MSLRPRKQKEKSRKSTIHRKFLKDSCPHCGSGWTRELKEYQQHLIIYGYDAMCISCGLPFKQKTGAH